jgi:tetratricopeptide (TPR) repeat protein
MNKVMLILILILFPILLVLMLLPAILWQEPLDAGDVVLLVLIPLVIFLFARLYVIQRRFLKVNELLFDQCDPEAYLEATRQLLSQAEKRGQTVNIQALRINVNAGLQAAGRYQEALASMPDASQFKNNRIGRMLRVVFHHNNFEAFVALGNLEQAEMALAWLNDALPALKGSSKQTERSRLMARMDEALLAMARGRFDGAEAVFQEAIDKAQNNYQRVSSVLELGRIHAHFGRAEQAREAFGYVIAHGNKLFAVAEAQKELEALAGA